MSLTRVTQVVMSSNAISTEKIANATIITRHVAGGAITSDKLGANANLAQIIANVNIVSDNAGGTNDVQDNLTVLENNVLQNFYNVGAYLNMDDTITVDAVNSNVTIGEHFSRTSNTRTLPFSRLTVLGNTGGELISFSRGDANTRVRGAIGYHNDSVFIGNRASSDNARLDLRVGGVDTTADTLVSLLPTGKVGIGTVVPSHNFDVRGTANVLSLDVADDVSITGNLTVLGQTTTVNSISLIIEDRMIALANSQPTGTAPSEDVGIFFNRGNQGNAAFFYDESAKAFTVADTKDPFTNTAISIISKSNLNVGITDTTTLKLNGTTITADATEINILDGVTGVTAAEINRLDGVTDPIQTQLNLKDTKANVSATFIQLTANLNATTANIDIVQDNVASITGGATLLNPFQNVNTATGSSNVFFIGKAVPADKIERVVVSISGVNQAIDQPGTSNNDYIVHHANNTVQFTAATIPSGEKIVIHAFH